MNKILTEERNSLIAEQFHPVDRKIRGQVESHSAPSGGLLDPFVNPPVQDRWNQLAARNYTPESVRGIIQGTNINRIYTLFHLFEMMEDTSPIVSKNLFEIRTGASRVEYAMEPFRLRGKEPTPSAVEKAEVAGDILKGMRPDSTYMQTGFKGMLFDLADSYGKGATVTEVDWKRGKNSDWEIQGTRWVSPEYFDYPIDPETTDRLVLNVDPFRTTEQADFPLNKFLISQFRARSGARVTDISFLRMLAPWWIFANFSIEWLMTYAQLFGVPIRWATYSQENVTAKAKIENMLSEMGSSAWAAFPKGVDLQILESGKSTASNPQSWVIDRYDKYASQLFLGGTLTGGVDDGGGNRALGEVHERTRGERIETLAINNCEVINHQLIPSIIRVNFGNDDELPNVVPNLQQDLSPLQRLERDRILVTEIGIEVAEDYFHVQYGIAKPSKDQKVFRVKEKAKQVGVGGVREVSDDVQDDVTEEERIALSEKAEEIVKEIPENVKGSLSRLNLKMKKDFVTRIVMEKME